MHLVPGGDAEPEATTALWIDAGIHEIGEAEIAAGGGQARLAPLHLVIGAQRHVGVDLQLAGNLSDRPRDFLELRVRHRQRACQVEGRLCTGDAVAAKEQALAVELGEATGLEVEVHARGRQVAVHEGIEKLGLATVQLLGCTREFVVRRRALVDQRPAERTRVVVRLVVHLVVPGSAAEAEPHVALEAHVEFGEQVEAIGDQAAVKIEVPVIGIRLRPDRVVRHLRVHATHPPAGAVLDGVVPRHADIRVAGVDLERRGRPARHDCSSRDERHRAASGNGVAGTLFHVFLLMRFLSESAARSACGDATRPWRDERKVIDREDYRPIPLFGQRNTLEV